MKSKHNIFDEQNQVEIKSENNVFGKFLVEKGLYDETEITEKNINELISLIGGNVKLDVYCPECKEKRVFSCEAIPYYCYDMRNSGINKNSLSAELQAIQKQPYFVNNPDFPWKWIDTDLKNHTRVMVFKYMCAMDDSHHLDYVVITDENKMKKIGQYPSVADLSFPELKEFKKTMSKEDEKELKRAIGLYAQGIGIGSFVYLRRIFERIIYTAGEMAKEDNKINDDDFNTATIKEKIKMLADYLPKLLVDNAVFYGIVSKGIHELSDKDCLEYFPVMQSFIMMILRQWEQVRKEKEDEKNLKDSLNKIAGKVN